MASRRCCSPVAPLSPHSSETAHKFNWHDVITDHITSVKVLFAYYNPCSTTEITFENPTAFFGNVYYTDVSLMLLHIRLVCAVFRIAHAWTDAVWWRFGGGWRNGNVDNGFLNHIKMSKMFRQTRAMYKVYMFEQNKSVSFWSVGHIWRYLYETWHMGKGLRKHMTFIQLKGCIWDYKEQETIPMLYSNNCT